jgi:creatinine amidohydrolase
MSTVQLTDYTWPEIASIERSVPVVLPVAALEQHGHHLPLFTDSMLLAEVVRRVEQHLMNQVLFAPLLWLGNSEHHLDFPGTMSASPRTYLDLVGDMVENFVRHGFRRIVVLNGHGGNIVPAQQALFELRQQHRSESDLLLLAATYWNCATTRESAVWLSRIFVQQEMGHACEWETSMMLRLAPHLVRDRSKLEAVSLDRSFAPASRAWITRDRTQVGHIGDPGAATAEKGELLFQAFSAEVTSLLRRVVDWDGKSWNF